ncbi:MAG TPA: hypothetical protein VG936_03960 [Lacunisphaera sp.]|nr:hypothetical protein [Lacunisphaera sp.]
MLNPDQRPKVALEDLLRLKRTERPAPEFWATFESEMRQKQLAALLEKRTWWQGLSQLLVRHAYLPVGATAVLAFTLVSVKYYVPSQPTTVVPTSPTKSLASVNRAAVSAPVSATVASRTERSASLPAAPSPAIESTPVADDMEAMAAGPEAAAPVASSSTTVDSPSSRYIANNLDRLERTDPELVQSVLGSRLSAPARVQSAALMTDELTSVPTGTSRRSRLLAHYTDHLLTPEPTAPEIVRERLARRLGDSDISDRISRIGLKGDQVSLGVTLRL